MKYFYNFITRERILSLRSSHSGEYKLSKAEVTEVAELTLN